MDPGGRGEARVVFGVSEAFVKQRLRPRSRKVTHPPIPLDLKTYSATLVTKFLS